MGYGKNFKAERIRLGVTRKYIVDKTGVTHSTLSKFETEKGDIYLKTLIRIVLASSMRFEAVLKKTKQE